MALELVFELDRETKNTQVFIERRRRDLDKVVGTIYLQKKEWDRLGSPDTLTVRIDAGEPT